MLEPTGIAAQGFGGDLYGTEQAGRSGEMIWYLGSMEDHIHEPPELGSSNRL